MTTMIAEPPAFYESVLQDGLATLANLTWSQFEQLDALFPERRFKLCYLDGTLEIMSPLSDTHENVKSGVGLLLEAYFQHAGIRFYTRGGPTLKKIGRFSCEPDESYCIGSYKDQPDLVIEVIVTSGSIRKLDGYRLLKIPEVWFWKKGKLTLYGFTPDGYQQLERSGLLPDLDVALLEACAKLPDQYDTTVKFRQTLSGP